MKKIVKIVVTAILLLMAVPTLALLAGGLAESPVLSWSAFGNLAQKSGWNDGVRQEIRAAYEPLNEVSGIPAEVTDAFLEENLTDEVCSLFWAGAAGEFPTEDWAVDLVMRIKALAEQMREDGEIILTDAEWQELSDHFGSTATYYLDTAQQKILLSGYGARLQGAADLCAAAMPKLLLGSGALAAGSLLVLALIYRRRFLLIGYAAGVGSGLVLLAPALWLKAADYAARLQLNPPYLKEFLKTLYASASARLLLAGVILAVLGLICGGVQLALNRSKKTEPDKVKEKEEK